MIALSPRFAAAAGALLLAAAVPVLLHAALRPTHDDCRDPDSFFGAPLVAGAEVTPVAMAKGALVGVEGELERPERAPLSVRILRTFEPSRLYARPGEFGFDSELYLEDARTRWIPAGDHRLALHWRTHEWSDRIAFEAYSLAQGGASVWHPIESGLALAGTQLLAGTRPVTVFILAGRGLREELPELTRAADQWLADAWRELEAACAP